MPKQVMYCLSAVYLLGVIRKLYDFLTLLSKNLTVSSLKECGFKLV